MKRIKVLPGFAASGLLLAAFTPLSALLSFYAAATAHEAAHLAVIMLLGGEIKQMELGFLEVRICTGTLKYRTEFFAVLAGPCLNLACGMIFRTLWPSFAAMSMLLGIFNLLPVWPLDGSKAIRSGLSMLLPPTISDGICISLSYLVMGILLLFALYACKEWNLGIWPILFAGGIVCRVLLTEQKEKHT